jgi:TolA-binding protein
MKTEKLVNDIETNFTNTKLEEITRKSASKKIQKAFKKPIQEGLEITKLENQIKKTEDAVDGYKVHLNKNQGVQLRKKKADVTRDIHNIKKSAKTNEEKNKLLEPKLQKVKELTDVIIPKKRGRKLKIKNAVAP